MSLINRMFSVAAVMVCMFVVAGLSGCGPQVVPASQHAPTSPNEVKFFQKQPAKYEELGMITVPVTAEMKWNEKGDCTPAFEALKTKAAAKGANGVLLIAQPGSFDVLATAGYKGAWYQVPVKREPKTLVVQAIYVINE